MTDSAPREPRLAGRTALVTGGSRGVGRAVATRLATEGAAVAINYRRDEQAAIEVVEEITAAGGRAALYQASVDNTEAVADMLTKIAVDLGTVDLLVSNAGSASRGKTIADTGSAEFLALLGVHTLGPIRLIQSVLPGMRSARGGRADIVMISSALTDTAPANAAPYTMAKAAMEAAMRTLAREERVRTAYT